jgi:phage-related protein
VIYVASIGTRIYALHAFHKKSKQGIETPKTEIELARRRYQMLVGGTHE